MKKQWKQALRGNRGSGIIMVVITMLFVMILGATLLYTSYTGYLMKITERGGKANFYDAGAMMDQVVAGLQKTTSDAIAGAYGEILTDYSALEDHQAAFENQFLDRMLRGGGPINALGGGTQYNYRSSALYNYAEVPAGGTLRINGYDGSGLEDLGTATLDPATSTITLKNVRVSYTQDGYQSTVTTDICIDMPDFYQFDGSSAISGLPDYALVARGGLISEGATLAGNTYAGTVTMRGRDTALEGRMSLISGGAISLTQGAATFEQGSDCALWGTDLIVGAETAAALNGRSYLADDLELERSARVALAGEYYGFGGAATANESSAILANGAHATLDLTGARRLLLAGTSFINGSGGGVSGSDILMSQSIAAKSDQRIYLLPDEYLPKITVSGREQSGANPMIVAVSTGSLNLDDYRVVVPTELAEKYSGLSISTLAYPLHASGGYTSYVIYRFMKFSTVADVNAFFSAYFAEHPDRVQAYLENYLTITGQAASLQAQGYTLTDGTRLNSLATPESMAFLTSRYATFYENLCIALTTTRPERAADGATNPYDYYVKDDEVARGGAGPTAVTTASGTKYWVVDSNDYTVSAGANAPELIIAHGNVTVTTDYKGLILCGGTVTVQNGATITTGGESDALLGDEGVAKYLVAYGHTSDPDEEGEHETWGLDGLVYYRNWSKN